MLNSELCNIVFILKAGLNIWSNKRHRLTSVGLFRKSKLESTIKENLAIFSNAFERNVQAQKSEDFDYIYRCRRKRETGAY